ncbi:hypothetical protein HCN44_008867 [Aphidius gifuensis]|uniref:Replication protein A OB domain-containing protein n=2 Tax=Aphidius gifuensis TaxID=684658 RepID=A0A835CV44_APHGI|nr:hypothetical protein HCN44_008867 [Aphidius gifuensis]
MHNILPNDSDEEMSCFDSDEKEKLKNIYTKLLKKYKKNVMYEQNEQLYKDYENSVKINKSQLIAEKQIENDCKEFKEKDLMNECNEKMFEDHEDVLTHENEQQLINYHEEMIENYEEEQMENNCKELKEKDKEKMIENDGEVIKENSGEKIKENDGKKIIENDGEVIKENSGEKIKENDGKKIIENDGEVIKENSGEKMIENDEKMDDFDEFMSDSLVEPEDYENIISQANDKETKKDNKNDDENDKNKEVITVSKEPIDVKDINLTKLSELTITLQSSKIIVKVHSVYPCTRTNFFFIVQGNEKLPIMLCVAYPFIGNKLRNKIKPGTFIEITNACVKYIDSQHSILCDDSTFELVLNEFYKTKINILSVISNNINDLPSSSGILPEQSQSNSKVKPNKLFRKNSQPTVKPFIIKNNNNIKFTPFTTFAKQNYTKYEKINVIGRVLSYTTCSKIWTRDNEQTIRHVKLVDMSNNQLDASLWNKKAETFSPPLGSLVQIQKAGVRKYQGKNNLSVYDCSNIEVCKEDE